MSPADGAARPIGERVLALWCDIFGRPDIQAADDFFELGGHSILVMQMMTRAEDEFGVRITLRDFFKDPTPLRMAAMLRDSASPAEPEPDFGIDTDDAALADLLAQVEGMSDDDVDGAQPC